MQPDMRSGVRQLTDWYSVNQDLRAASSDLASATDQTGLQATWTRVLRTADECTELVNSWVASALELEPVREPRILLSLDVDGVLEEDVGGCSATGLTGAAALKLLQLGRVAVVLNSARSLRSVETRARTFQVLGGIGGFGGGIWDAVYGRTESIVSPAGIDQLNQLRWGLAEDAATVLDYDHELCIRASRIIAGVPAPVEAQKARQLLDDRRLSRLTFWIASRHTDFVDRHIDKWKGLTQFQEQLGMTELPVAAIGDSACDLPMLRKARFAFLPAGTLPSYFSSPGQKFMRSRYLGQQALWDAAKELVPDSGLQTRVSEMATGVQPPEWLPFEFCIPPRNQSIRSRLTAGWR